MNDYRTPECGQGRRGELNLCFNHSDGRNSALETFTSDYSFQIQNSIIINLINSMFKEHQCTKNSWTLVPFSTLLRYNLHIIKFIYFKYTIQRLLVNLESCATITTIQFSLQRTWLEPEKLKEIKERTYRR